MDTYAEFKTQLKTQGGWYKVFWNDDAEAEDRVKTETKASLRCYPIGEQDIPEGAVCFYSGKPATHLAIFARAY